MRRKQGQGIPGSNVTVETELPALLNRHQAARFTFHSSRMRMQAVSEEALRAMNAQRERCVAELTDASYDALDLAKADALILSACVQMPSLPLIELAEAEFGLPVLSASTATAFTLLHRLELPTVLPGAGHLLQKDRRDRK
jgi:maleate cis-trans isomerase